MKDIDVRKFIGQVHEVAVQTAVDTWRTITIAIADAGPCPFWDHRPMLAMECSFAQDGRRSHEPTAYAAMRELAERLFAPYTVGMMGGEGWALKVDRTYRDHGPKLARTSFTYTVFLGPLPTDPAVRARELAQVEARFAAAMHG
jgi:hypothetical protein